MNIQIATSKDIDQLCNLLIILMEQEADFTPNIEAHKRGLEMIINTPETGKIIKLEEGNKIIGMISMLFSISSALGAKVATFEDFIILPNHRGKGYGTQLFGYALQEAQSSGCKRISLLTDKDNTKAHSFYQKQGMERSAMVPFRLVVSGK